MEQTPKRIIRTNFSRAEAIGGIIWICFGAVISLLLEVFYLGARISILGLGSVAFPWPILAALLFNAVLTKTAMLWTNKMLIALCPVAVWGLGFVLLAILPGITGDQLLASSLRSMVLLLAGLAGGFWPIYRRRWHTESAS